MQNEVIWPLWLVAAGFTLVFFFLMRRAARRLHAVEEGRGLQHRHAGELHGRLEVDGRELGVEERLVARRLFARERAPVGTLAEGRDELAAARLLGGRARNAGRAREERGERGRRRRDRSHGAERDLFPARRGHVRRTEGARVVTTICAVRAALCAQFDGRTVRANPDRRNASNCVRFARCLTRSGSVSIGPSAWPISRVSSSRSTAIPMILRR